MIKVRLKSLYKDQRGLSLLELVITIALLGIATLTTATLLSHGVSYFRSTESQVANIDNLNSAMNFMTRAIRESRKSDNDIPDTAVTVSTLVYEVGTQLSYTDHNASNIEGNLIRRPCLFKVENGVLQRVVGGSSQALTSAEVEVTKLEFTRYTDTGNIQIDVAVRYKDGKTASISSEATPRVD